METKKDINLEGAQNSNENQTTRIWAFQIKKMGNKVKKLGLSSRPGRSMRKVKSLLPQRRKSHRS